MSNNEKLSCFYQTLLQAYGAQHWWPGDSAFEVMVGAVLTQNTNWANVEKAIDNLKRAKKLEPQAINRLDHDTLAELIRPAGYFNIKARRLKNLIAWFCERYGGDIKALRDGATDILREELLNINGIGRETADSILLYALDKLTFVVDTYTYRVLSRHGCIDIESDYEEIKDYCQSSLPGEVSVYNEFHALIVQVGKRHCKPRPQCAGCPLESFEHTLETPE